MRNFWNARELKEVVKTIEEVEKKDWPTGLKKQVIYHLYNYFRETQGHLYALMYVYTKGRMDGIRSQKDQDDWNNFALFNNVKSFFNDPATRQKATYKDFCNWFEERTGYHYE